MATLHHQLAIAAAVLALALPGCATAPAAPKPQTPAAAASDSPGRIADDNDVVLLPTEDFSFEFAADLARGLARDSGLRIRAVLNLGSGEWRPYANAPQYDPAKLRELALPAIMELKKTHGGSLYILLTTHDIKEVSGNLRFVFAQSYPQDRLSVVSAARMLGTASGQPASAEVVGERLRKMTLRTIALLYLGLPRSSDPKDLLYSPLMSLDALDALEPRLPRRE